MCGLTGLVSESLTVAQLELLMGLYYEASVRGLHAFGAAYGVPGEELTVERTHDIGDIMGKTFDNIRAGYLRRPFIFLGHARYDTSGDWRVLENNQPLVDRVNGWQSVGAHYAAPMPDHKLLLFNGVIRMSTREEYEAEFGCHYPTDNDGHIALEMFGRSKDDLLSLLSQPTVSFAGLFYSPMARGVALRNDRRPLWEAHSFNAHWVCSTRDIFVRAGAPDWLLDTAQPLPVNELVLL